MDKVQVQLLDWGRISYQEAWDKQTKLHNELKEIKISNRRSNTNINQKHYLIFCEHDPVYTLGKSGSLDHLLLNEKELAEQAISFHKINRGGDITYHGPGQIVAYPIFDLDQIFTDVHKYVRYLEEVIIRTLAEYKIPSGRISDFTGVWLGANKDEKARKICAIGVHLSRWVTMHGLAFNVNTDLKYFNNIIPCGINDEDKEVCSMASILSAEVDYQEVKNVVKMKFEEVFNIDVID